MSDDIARTAKMFNAPAAGYDQLMGRYAATLAPALCDFAGVGAGMRLLDVGCGPGGLTSELVARSTAEAVAAIDPSPPFVEACRARNPGVDVRMGFAEELPFADDAFDAALSSLVIPFMHDAEAGIREMARVTMPGGTVAICFWDLDRMPSLQLFDQAVRSLDSSYANDTKMHGATDGDLMVLLRSAGLAQLEGGSLPARSSYENFNEWWTPFTFGIGPAGAYCQSLDADHQEDLRLACRALFADPNEPFTLEAHAWCARGRRGGGG